jgi:hypothetical protein
MKETNIRLILCDVEGCLTPPNRGIMIPEQLTAISEYCKSARNDKSLPPLVLCTGRQIPYAECVAQLIGAFFPGFPSIAENGAFLYDVAKNEIIPNSILTSEVSELLKDVREQTDELIKNYKAKKEYGKDICISLNPPDNLKVEEFYEIVREALTNFNMVIEITYSKSAVDITPTGVNKGSGVRQISEYTGITFEEMLGIGDTRGDMPMLEIIGTPTGPANASSEVRKIAKYIAPNPEVIGVVDILRQFTSWK